ncbi:hypothetical protein EN836_17920 [Mesorhizobium sp. M1C.F.Ca.ET.193.01.1.1]|nr:MAG: hypothetical protein EOQ28_31810 [Mesorhizobium sp.]TGQ52752.1 hypothetical protein EN853_18615 [Mesorhizobium sp. M1C.F.Ca.ET.210.01.1.1]TGQ69926.1 hypothetical protein EN855_017925 [Mesorhizobium sp. M1C.F.Ca.ET.212.01.1.1]TGR05620.1 hypothetical protein EN847_18620 [Mesorhizobium sp. M1C.F.Ca.ET.204.01.1.1]TGR26162.1 hypothetical protein EN839_17920 [Mesorhizobium sp. M1C.F.Ca.ET.196.01.1.1]TGR49139.1 hypothetical protein EN838_18615 [Mesorhizobium sp. M1C.F.Ca.ET.195.01.1.1]TGR638
MLFEPLDSDGGKRSAIYHAARLAMLHNRLAKKIEQVDHAADQVEQAAAVLVEAAHELPSTRQHSS